MEHFVFNSGADIGVFVFLCVLVFCPGEGIPLGGSVILSFLLAGFFF